jgi:hypothetical protein
MTPISTLRTRVQKLEVARSTKRRFIVCAGLEEELDRAAIATLPGEVTVVLTGVPYADLRPPTVWELVDDRWILFERDLAA